MIQLLLLAASLLITYFVIRKAVHHGILDADDTRAARERQDRLDTALRDGTLPDAPTS